MKNEQHEQARDLYFQTNMSKTEIAEKVGVSRKTILFWSKEDNWDKLRQSARNVPSLVAEKCYHLIDQYASDLLGTGVGYNSLTLKHAQTIHLLAASIKKLKNRSTVNESMELFNFFLEGLKRREPELARQITPQIEQYISVRNDAQIDDFLQDGFDANGLLSFPVQEAQEQYLDEKEYKELTREFTQFLNNREVTTPVENTTPTPDIQPEPQQQSEPEQPTNPPPNPDEYNPTFSPN